MKWSTKLKPFTNKIIAVDFDGTVVSNKFPRIGVPRMELVSWLKKCKANGCSLILWTSRSNNLIMGVENALDKAVEFCKDSLELEFDAVNENIKAVQEEWKNDTRKVYADYYLDDKCLSYE
jgi:hypothetical protein